MHFVRAPPKDRESEKTQRMMNFVRQVVINIKIRNHNAVQDRIIELIHSEEHYMRKWICGTWRRKTIDNELVELWNSRRRRFGGAIIRAMGFRALQREKTLGPSRTDFRDIIYKCWCGPFPINGSYSCC